MLCLRAQTILLVGIGIFLWVQLQELGIGPNTDIGIGISACIPTLTGNFKMDWVEIKEYWL